MEGGKAGRNAFFLLIFTGEDNEGKHFHFKGIVHRKSECDLSGQGSLYGGNQGATGESVVKSPGLDGIYPRFQREIKCELPGRQRHGYSAQSGSREKKPR